MNNEKYLNIAIILAIVTVFYNLVEGIVSVYFGAEDETLALFGFGMDSFVEVISGIGIWHMVLRIKNNRYENRDDFEKTALKITGTMFYLLAFGLLVTSVINIIYGKNPETTFWGIVISLISILTMWLLVWQKKKVGKILNSDAIIADANCTKTCLQLSVVLLISSVGYEMFRIGSIDSIGSILIAWFAFREGKESFEKAKNKATCCSC